MKRNFRDLLETRWDQGKFVCVGIDPDIEKFPRSFQEYGEYSPQTTKSILVSFCTEIINATKDLVCAYKPNTAFFERYGDQGWSALGSIIAFINENAPDVPVILDAKRADIGNTNQGYVKAAFDDLNADAITLHPYLGEEALRPFLDQTDKGIIVLCRTSNPGAGEFQDAVVQRPNGTHAPLHQMVARHVAEKWNKHGNCAIVVGATYTDELRAVREIVGDLPILIPGIGAQGGDLAATIAAGQDSKKAGIIINVSRSVLYASSTENFSAAARVEVLKLNEQIIGHLVNS